MRRIWSRQIGEFEAEFLIELILGGFRGPDQQPSPNGRAHRKDQ